MKDYPKEVTFEEEAKRLNRPLFVPPWFTVDLKVGVRCSLVQQLVHVQCLWALVVLTLEAAAVLVRARVRSMRAQLLTITLDEADCFAAWISLRDAGLLPASDSASDTKGTCLPLLCTTYLCTRTLQVIDDTVALHYSDLHKSHVHVH